MTRSRDELLDWLSGAPLLSAAANGLVAELPWVHRSGRPGSGKWLGLFEEAAIRTRAACTQVEREQGHPVAAYLFLGSAAYPKGQIAILLDHRAVVGRGGTFTPFDSGGLLGLRMTSFGLAMEVHNAIELWTSLHGDLEEVDDVAAGWIAAHFVEPDDYVRRAMVSEPDVAPIHGLRAEGGLRLGWTIEAQVARDVPLDAATVLDVVCERRALALQLPLVWQARASYLDDEDDADLDQAVAKRILGRLGSTR